jgi:multicomponent Na+:H+ antiporter subunit A
MIWIISLLLYFACSAVLWGLGRRAPRTAVVAGLAPFSVHLVVVAITALGGAPDERVAIEWIPSLGVTFTLRIDALTLVLWAVVAGVGLLVVAYSAAYFRVPERRSRFLALILLFTGGMVGIVSIDELLGVFVFWEVTTIASYLLIGFDDESAAARSAALQAVLVTSLGGLAMLGGIVLLLVETGTTSIEALTAAPPGGGVATAALVLLLAGAFTKSAQVPFHFWLPGAMAAPTPASAYLHSATMVKAGIVLLLLVEPIFGAHAAWGPMVTSVGLATMVVGALAALRQDDLKLLLAHGTVSQLGFMTALLGLGQIASALAVLIAHAAFKAALFLFVGVIDARTGTRSISALGGLRRSMPVVAIGMGLTAASMAGIPPLLGFVTKEAAYDVLVATGDWLPLGVIVAASVVTVAYSGRLWLGAFRTRETDVEVSRPRPVMTSAPAVLAAFSLVFGLVPTVLGPVVEAAVGSKVKLVLWPGFTTPLAVSAITLAAGLVMLRIVGVEGPSWHSRIPRFGSAEKAYAATVRGLNRTADIATGILQNGSLPVYLAVILTTVTAIPAVVWIAGWDGLPDMPIANGPIEIALGLGIAVAAIAATRVDRRMAAALLLGVVGFSMAGIFVAFGAPDLALTQLLVETLTVALFAFVLVRLPRRFGAEPGSITRRTRLLVAGLVGIAVTVGSLTAAGVDPARDVSTAYLEGSEAAGGRNVVNVILTDFRALDTLGEISVLAIAAAGVSALVIARRRPEADEEVPA